MEQSFIERVIEAKKYGKLAVRALLPEQAAVHLDNIEKELKAIITECVIDIVRHEKEEVKQDNTSSNIKKVKID